MSKYYEYAEIPLNIFLFYLTFYVFAPILHELGHIVVLYTFHCPYFSRIDIVFLRSFFGKTYQNCVLSPIKQFLVYIAGITTTSLFGLIFAILDVELTKKGKLREAITCIFISIGFFMNTAVYFFEDVGDVKFALEAIGMSAYSHFIKLIGVSIILFALIIMLLNLIHHMEIELEIAVAEEEGRKEDEVKTRKQHSRRPKE